MMVSPGRQDPKMERWPQSVGQLFQAEIEKAVVQGLTAAFRTLAERLPQLLAEFQQHLTPLSSAPAGTPANAPGEKLRDRCVAIEESAAVDRTGEHPSPMTTVADLAAASEAVADAPAAARPYLRRAEEARRAGDTERAVLHYTRALCLEASAPAYLARGRLLYDRGRNDDAIDDATEALRLNPRLAAAYFLRAAVLIRRGDNTQAIADLKRFLELEPDQALAYHARGLAFTNEGNFVLAIRDFGRALRLRPNLLSARYQRAIAYRLKGDYMFASAELTRILDARPDFARGYFERGLALLAQEDHDGAIADFDKALKLAPQDDEIRKRRQQAMQTRELVRKAVPAPSENGRRQPGGNLHQSAGAGRSPPSLSQKKAEPADPTFLSLSCPQCGATARISWNRLDRLFRCRHCARIFRVNREGHLKEMDPNPVASRRSRLGRRALASAVSLLLILVLAGGLYCRFHPRPPLAALPQDLPSRGKLWGNAWLNSDRLLLRSLTSPAHDRQLHPWLLRHPPSSAKKGEPSVDPSASPEIQLQVRKTKPHQAVVIVRITASSLKTPREFSLDWVERGDTWYFVPLLKR